MINWILVAAALLTNCIEILLAKFEMLRELYDVVCYAVFVKY